MRSVLFLTSAPSDRGGVAVWAKTIMDNKHLFKDYKLHFVYTMQYTTNGAKKTFYEKYIKNLFDIGRIKKEVKKIIKEEKIDLLHVTLTGGFGLYRDYKVLKIAKKNGIKTVIHLHFGSLPQYKEKNNIKFKLFKKCHLLSDAAWCLDKNSLDVCDSIKSGCNYLMPNFIDCSDKNADNKKENLITFVGWVTKSKGVEELLQAWEKLSLKFPDYRLQIVGPFDDKYKNDLVSRYNLNKVIFAGKVSHETALDMIKKSKVFVLPSHTEGFPLVILEAMMFGIPIVSSDVGCIKDILSNNCGLVGQPNDSVFVYDSIFKLLTDSKLYATISKNSYNKVRKCYDVKVVLNKYISVWEETLNGK